MAKKKPKGFNRKGYVCKNKKTIIDVNGRKRKVCTKFGPPTAAEKKKRAKRKKAKSR